MKRNRMMIKRRRRKGNIVLIAVFCIILPIAAIYLGLQITEHLVSPALNNDDYTSIIDVDDGNGTGNEDTDNDHESKENNEGNNRAGEDNNVNQVTSEFRPLTVYTIQIASVADRTNLDGFIGELNRQKLPNLIYKMEDGFKVYVVGGTKRNHVEVELERVRVNYPDAYINETRASARKLQYPQGEAEEILKEIVKDFNEMVALLEEQGEAWYNFYKKEGELDSYIEMLKKQQVLIGQLSKNLTEVELPESFPQKDLMDKMISFQEGNINRSIEFYQEDQEENIHRLHSLYLDNLFRTLEIIKG